jgi:hypothetical protein
MDKFGRVDARSPAVMPWWSRLEAKTFYSHLTSTSSTMVLAEVTYMIERNDPLRPSPRRKLEN